MKIKKQIITLFACFSTLTHAQSIQFEPLVDNWMISEEITFVEADNSGSPVVAEAGGGYVVIWPISQNQGTSFEGVFLNASGEIQMETRFTIQQRMGNLRFPKIASVGDTVLVVYQVGFSNNLLMASRVNTKGEVLDPQGFEIRQAPSGTNIMSGAKPAYKVTSDDKNYLVVWGEWPESDPHSRVASWSIYGQQFNIEGLPLKNTPTLFTTSAGSDIDVAVGSNDQFLIVAGTYSVENPDLNTIIRVDREIENVSVGKSAVQMPLPLAASNGQKDLVVWTDNIASGEPEFWEVAGSLVPPDVSNHPLDVIAITNKEQRRAGQGLASDGESFFVIWDDQRNWIPLPSGARALEVYGARISFDGNLMDPDGLPLVTGPRWAVPTSIASNGFSYVFLYIDRHSNVTGNPDADAIKAKLIINADRYLMLSDLSLNQEGQLQFQFTAAPGYNFVIERTSDFQSWSELTRFNNFSGEAMIIDDASGNASGFYRARRVDLKN